MFWLFLSFKGSQIQTEPSSIWALGGGSTTDFKLDPNLVSALKVAQANGKKIILSLGGETASDTFLAYWNSKGNTTSARVSAIQSDLQNVANQFNPQNGLTVNGYDLAVELTSGYAYGSEKYNSTRDVINAIPTGLTAAFGIQVGNGLCAAPNLGDPLNPNDTLGGQCMQKPVDGTSWTLARLDDDCKTPSGAHKLDYYGVQYYNVGVAVCCGGGANSSQAGQSTAQHYKNFAIGWPQVTADQMADPNNPWHQWANFPGPWAAYMGLGSTRLVLGKPGCQGCAGSDYLAYTDTLNLINSLKGKVQGEMGGILFYDLCRLFGSTGTFCVTGQCQPSWGGSNIVSNLNNLYSAMQSV